MVSSGHADILKRGVKVWNEWRSTNLRNSYDIRWHDESKHDPSLTPSQEEIAQSYLPLPNLSGHWFPDEQLAGANLDYAELLRTNFRNANLHEAGLHRANLTEADLSGANLSLASLTEADLRRARLDGTNLAGASLGGTILADIDLSSVIGLESTRHHIPSIIDYRTLLRSRNLPLIFMRNCGVPEQLIEYLPSLLTNPIQFYSCFISYANSDQPFADRLYSDLQSAGVRCWFAPHNIQGGRKLYDQIDEAIRVYDRLLLILSDHSMRSEWVKTEIANARRREISEGRKMLFPLSLVPFDHLREWSAFDADTGKDTAREIREYYIPDFSEWKDHDSYRTAFDGLVRDLRSEAFRPPK